MRIYKRRWRNVGCNDFIVFFEHGIITNKQWFFDAISFNIWFSSQRFLSLFIDWFIISTDVEMVSIRPGIRFVYLHLLLLLLFPINTKTQRFHKSITGRL